MIDKSLLEKYNDMLDEINDILRIENVVMKNAINKILSPILNKMDKGMNNLGKKYQEEVL